MGWPGLIGVCDVLKHRVGRIIVCELQALPQVVFCLEWPQEVQLEVILTVNSDETITNLDLECAGLLVS